MIMIWSCDIIEWCPT